ncbi:Protein of unknown function [Pyronema omphalodes CBS 100304]|uniref:Uncharacterized protein n=1 Tax=Pyronema omphalodes (strain CBS 100304) TaxID=1076935 RepID=U4LRT3_PYROM|nr:Protein of unknown function [Pyronema omphalodes CBS 100304]
MKSSPFSHLRPSLHLLLRLPDILESNSFPRKMATTITSFEIESNEPMKLTASSPGPEPHTAETIASVYLESLDFEPKSSEDMASSGSSIKDSVNAKLPETSLSPTPKSPNQEDPTLSSNSESPKAIISDPTPSSDPETTSGSTSSPSATNNKFYFQRETHASYRSSAILTFSVNPDECKPVYTIKHHPQFVNPLSFLPYSKKTGPDITLYRGGKSDGDAGDATGAQEVVATATIKNSIFAKGLGEVKISGTSSGAVSEVFKIKPNPQVGHAVFTYAGKQLYWLITASQQPPLNAAQQNTTPPVEGENQPRAGGLRGTLNDVISKKREVLLIHYTAKLMEVTEAAAEELAVYEDIMPINPPTTREFIWENGHVGILEFKQGLVKRHEVSGEFVDAATAALVLMIERAKRGMKTVGKGFNSVLWSYVIPWNGGGFMGDIMG